MPYQYQITANSTLISSVVRVWDHSYHWFRVLLAALVKLQVRDVINEMLAEKNKRLTKGGILFRETTYEAT